MDAPADPSGRVIAALVVAWGSVAMWWLGDPRGVRSRRIVPEQSSEVRAAARTPVDWRLMSGGLAVVALASPTVATIGAGIALLRWSASRARARRAAEQFDSDLVAVLDQLAVCVTSGLTLALAVEAVGGAVDGPVGHWLRVVQRRLALGEPLALALESTVASSGAALSSVISSIAARDRTGAPQDVALRAAAVRQRQLVDRRREVRIRRLPVWLLLPLTCCVLPAVAVVIVVPQLVVFPS